MIGDYIMNYVLWEKEIPYLDIGAETPNSMTFYPASDPKNDKPLPCVLVCPGGAYSHRAAHEGEPIARFFNSKGIHAAVVDYRVAPNRYPAPLADAQRAIKLLRAHSTELNVDPNKIVICGFSAGGHLAASVLLLDDVSCFGHTPDQIDMESAAPNGAILCYPVISIKEDFGHTGTGMNLLGEKYAFEADYFSLQNRISDKTPKCFLWHTSDDSCVNVKNSLIFGEYLRDHNIQFEMHIYPHGSHGLGLAADKPDVSGWASNAADWVLRNI